MDDDPRNDTTKTAEIIELSEYLPDETPRNLGAEVVRIADFQQRSSINPKPKQTSDSSGELAAVYDLDVKPPEENLVRTWLDEIINEITSLPKQQDNADTLLGEISKSIASIFERLDDRQKLRLSAQLSFGLSGCDEKILDAAARYPTLLHTVAIAAKLPKEDYHPAHRIPRIKATGVLSMIPGEYDLATGTYTPPNQ